MQCWRRCPLPLERLSVALGFSANPFSQRNSITKPFLFHSWCSLKKKKVAVGFLTFLRLLWILCKALWLWNGFVMSAVSLELYVTSCHLIARSHLPVTSFAPFCKKRDTPQKLVRFRGAVSLCAARHRTTRVESHRNASWASGHRAAHTICKTLFFPLGCSDKTWKMVHLFFSVSPPRGSCLVSFCEWTSLVSLWKWVWRACLALCLSGLSFVACERSSPSPFLWPASAFHIRHSNFSLHVCHCMWDQV